MDHGNILQQETRWSSLKPSEGNDFKLWPIFYGVFQLFSGSGYYPNKSQNEL